MKEDKQQEGGDLKEDVKWKEKIHVIERQKGCLTRELDTGPGGVRKGHVEESEGQKGLTANYNDKMYECALKCNKIEISNFW